MPVSILLIEDDLPFARRLAANLKKTGYEVAISTTGSEAIDALAQKRPDIAITDLKLPDMDGLEIIRSALHGPEAIAPNLPFVVLTSVRDVETAVEAMRLGAADYLTKESEREEILVRIERALQQAAIASENRYLRDALKHQNEFGDMVGNSSAMQNIRREIQQIANQDVPVLIQGETGVGKELVARAVHQLSDRANEPFVAVNCGALPDENLLLSELFGHEKGAFTGASQRKKGKFELAEKGTLFLDEVGEMSLDAQANILRAVENLQITTLGGNRSIQARCRLVFATNKDLEKEVAEKRFRQDLYYRIHLFPLHLPPLRKRKEDIAPLCRFFLDTFAQKHGRRNLTLDESALQALEAYDWPGNARELRNVMERLVIRATNPQVSSEEVAACGLLTSEKNKATQPCTLGECTLDEMEKRMVLAALEKSNWNQKEAAKLLGISPDRMQTRIRKFQISHPSWRVHR